MTKRRQRPPRPYAQLMDSLRKAWRIQTVGGGEAIWQVGAAELPALPADNIRITVWNLCKGVGGVLFEHDYRRLCYYSDLVLTQEALMSERSLATFTAPGFHLCHAASYQRRDGLRDGVMTATRAKIAAPPLRVLCKYPEPIFKTPKAALISMHPLQGHRQQLMVVNLHATLVRLKAIALEELQHLLYHLPEHDGPMILAGDFNTFTPGYLRAVEQTLAGHGLAMVRFGNDRRPTFGNLDQIFVRGLKIDKAWIDINTNSSDHFPLMVHLRTDNHVL